MFWMISAGLRFDIIAGVESWAAYDTIETVCALILQRLAFPETCAQLSASFTLFLLVVSHVWVRC
jgi:hypothetical protein